MEETIYEFPQWLKDMLIEALKAAGKSAAISLCKKYISNQETCEVGVSALMALIFK